MIHNADYFFVHSSLSSLTKAKIHMPDLPPPPPAETTDVQEKQEQPNKSGQLGPGKVQKPKGKMRVPSEQIGRYVNHP